MNDEYERLQKIIRECLNDGYDVDVSLDAYGTWSCSMTRNKVGANSSGRELAKTIEAACFAIREGKFSCE